MLLLRTYTVVPSAGEDRERPPRFYSTCNFPLPGVWLRKRITFKFGFKVAAPGLRTWSPGASAFLVLRASPSHLWLGATSQHLSSLSRILPHSREAKFMSLGMQSYSRLWYLSRGKHHMLYL
jgi:hypothetical protein